MNPKITAFLALLLAGASAYIWLFDAGRPGTRELAEQAGRVLPGKLDRTKVDGLLITQGNDAKIELRRDTSRPKDEPGALARWRVQSPLADRADASVVDTLLADLETLRRESTLPVPGANADRAQLARYGLQNPRLRLGIKGGGAGEKNSPDVELLFGNETAVEGKGYVQVAGREEVYVTGSSLRKQLEKPVAEWRDRQFTDLSPAEIARISVKNAAGTLELTKEGDGWRLLKPMNARAGGPRLTELVNRLTDLRVQSFLPEEKAAADAASFGLAEPRGTLTLATADNPPRTAELALGKVVEPPPAAAAKDQPPAEPAVYARAIGRPSVLSVPRTVEDFLGLKPADVRERTLARVNPDTVDRIRIRPAAGPEFTLSRARGAGGGGPEKAWTLREGSGATAGPERPAHGAEVERLLTRLPAQIVTEFVADTAAELPKYGLDQPSLRVTFLSVASETTAESGAGEKALATVEFGKTENNALFARLAEEPFIVTVDKTALNTVPADPLAWQAPEIFKTEPDAVRSLTVKLPDQPEIVLERAGSEANASWKPKVVSGGTAEGPAPELTKVQSAVNTLARLRAVRWVGATRPEQGLDGPQAAAFAFGPGPAGGGKLILGNLSPEGMWFARVEGRPGTFLISTPDHTTLTVPLMTAAPAPARPSLSSPSPVAPPR